RIRKLKEMLFTEFGIATQQELYSRHSFRWRGTDRECEVLVSNVRDVPVETLATGGATWRLILDYPFDQTGCSVRDDLEKLERFRQDDKPARTICWLPSFLNHKSMEQLGRLVRLDHILTENRFPTFVSHLSEVDRAAARALLENQRDVLCSQLKAQVEMAYGLRAGTPEYLDAANTLDLAEHFQSLEPTLALQPPAASNFSEGLQLLLDQALRNQFPAHPTFADDTSLTKGTVQKVFEVIQSAVRSTEPSVLVGDMATRKHLLRIAMALRLGDMGENRFQAGQHWKQHFEKLMHQWGWNEPVSVKTLRGWIEEPKPMGLPPVLEDLIILTFAEQSNRSFVLHGTAIDAQLCGLHEETVLQETPLPEEADWATARTRAKSVFGSDSSPLRNATNVAQMAAHIRAKMAEQIGSVRGLAKSVEDSCQQLGLPIEKNDRITSASAAENLLRHLEQAKDDRDLITRLGQVKLTVAEAALGASIMQAKPVNDSLKLTEWKIFLAIQGLEDDRRAAADRIWQDLAETFQSNEHVVALAARLRELCVAAVSLLARPNRPTPGGTGGGTGGVGGMEVQERPQTLTSKPASNTAWVGSDLGEVESFYGSDRSKIERNRKLVAELKGLYGRSQVEADDLPSWLNAEVTGSLLEVHHLKRLAEGGPDERSNMIVLTPTLHALVHLDPGAVIDLARGLLELPKFRLRAKVSVNPNHNG
ncbi:MAG: HNH endonuclease signature motif containing protein, partial [Verrucomicrobia bacterium]|nr:HNH endonuclease signature motif containing protein [Verrucomicrobiota bacterium]